MRSTAPRSDSRRESPVRQCAVVQAHHPQLLQRLGRGADDDARREDGGAIAQPQVAPVLQVRCSREISGRVSKSGLMWWSGTGLHHLVDIEFMVH